jgi:hypothetical protein
VCGEGAPRRSGRLFAFDHPRGAEAELLDEVRSLIVGSVADGPQAAYLLTPDRVVRVVLD